MIELIVMYTDDRHDYKNRDRKITLKVNEKLSIQILIDNVVDKLGLKSYDASKQKCIRYLLKVLCFDGTKIELLNDKTINEQLKEKYILILEGVYAENTIYNSEFGLATIAVGGSWKVKKWRIFSWF